VSTETKLNPNPITLTLILTGRFVVTDAVRDAVGPLWSVAVITHTAAEYIVLKRVR